jgi:uncharacterized integral membrane protein
MSVLRWVAGVLLFIVLLFVALQNAEPVTLRFYHWWSWQAPLIFMLLLAFAAGVAAGLLAGAVRSARLKRELARQRSPGHRADVVPGPHGAPPGPPPGSGSEQSAALRDAS